MAIDNILDTTTDRVGQAAETMVNLDFNRSSSIRPTLIKRFDDDDEQEPIEVTPVYTETFRASTENDSAHHRTLCGQSTTETIGEGEWHVTIEGMVIKDQLDDLKRMRPAEGEIKIIAEGFDEGVYVEFDRFTFTQTDDVNALTIEYDGEEVTQSAFTFQLQTDEEEN